MSSTRPRPPNKASLAGCSTTTGTKLSSGSRQRANDSSVKLLRVAPTNSARGGVFPSLFGEIPATFISNALQTRSCHEILRLCCVVVLRPNFQRTRAAWGFLFEADLLRCGAGLLAGGAEKGRHP